MFKALIALKNKQIRLERERSRGYKEANDILAAYLALLAKRHGSVRVPKDEIRGVLGGYRAVVGTVGDDYVITVERCDAATRSGGESNIAEADCGDGEN
jgi:hypothetical protein